MPTGNQAGGDHGYTRAAFVCTLVGSTHRPRVALVLSGGGALGFAHIGVIKVLEEMRVAVDCVVGTSMGALVAGSYAAGVDPHSMQQAITAHRDSGNTTLHRDWIALLLTEYYDPMYDYQLEKKRDRVVFQGRQAEIIDYLRDNYGIT